MTVRARLVLAWEPRVKTVRSHLSTNDLAELAATSARPAGLPPPPRLSPAPPSTAPSPAATWRLMQKLP